MAHGLQKRAASATTRHRKQTLDHGPVTGVFPRRGAMKLLLIFPYDRTPYIVTTYTGCLQEISATRRRTIPTQATLPTAARRR